MSRLEARIEPELKNLFLKAAQMQGTSLTNFIISSAKKEAELIFKQQTLINLTLSDAALFVQSFIENPEPTKKLKEAAKRFIKLTNL